MNTRDYGYETHVHEHTYSVNKRSYATAESALRAGIKNNPGKHIRVRYWPHEEAFAGEHRRGAIVVESIPKPV